MTLRSRLLLLCLLVLQIADVLTTNYALAGNSGTVEGNPLMAHAQAAWGNFWWLPKAPIMLFVAGAAFYLRSLPPRTALCIAALYSLIVANNIIGFV